MSRRSKKADVEGEITPESVTPMPAPGSRNRERPSGRNNGGSRSGMATNSGSALVPGLTGWLDNVKLTGPVFNKPHLYPANDGRVYGNDLFQNRVIPKGLQVVIRSWDPSFSFQSGTTKDADVTEMKTMTDQMFNMMVKDLFARKEISIRDTTIATPGNFDAYLSVYLQSLAILCTLESVLCASGLNRYMLVASNAVAARLVQLEKDYRWLLTLSCPPALMELIRRYFGVFCISDQGTVHIQGCYATATVPTDLTVDANIAAMLGQVETNLATLLTAGDNMIIGNVMKLLYGANTYKAMGIHQSVEDYWTYMGTPIFFRDTGTAKVYSTPNINYTPINTIPIIKSVEGKDPQSVFRLLRPAVFTTDPAAGLAAANIPNAVGLIQPTEAETNARGTVLFTVKQDGTTTTTEFAGANPFIISPFLEANAASWWAPYVSEESSSYTPALSTVDLRPMHELDIVSIGKQALIDQTFFEIERTFAR